MRTCFSAGKLMKQFGNPPFLKEPPLSTIQLTHPPPQFLSNFFITPLFAQILKIRNPPLILGGRENCVILGHKCHLMIPHTKQDCLHTTTPVMTHLSHLLSEHLLP